MASRVAESIFMLAFLALIASVLTMIAQTRAQCFYAFLSWTLVAGWGVFSIWYYLKWESRQNRFSRRLW